MKILNRNEEGEVTQIEVSKEEVWNLIRYYAERKGATLADHFDYKIKDETLDFAEEYDASRYE